MRRAAPLFTISLLCSVPLIGGGCVKQSEYDQMRMTNLSLQEQMVKLEDEREVAKANLDTVRQQLGIATNELNGLKQKYNLAEADLENLRASLSGLGTRVSEMDFGPLPAEMSEALEQLAAEHPNLLSFDAKRGMLRFASDFTFGSGSDQLSSEAMSTVSELARILNTPTAAKFEARVIGHTDNVPIVKVRQQHPTNWHLSAHRAISVGTALIASGVPSNRIQVAGYGEERPAVPNQSAKGGTPQNRRVEIFLVPMPDSAPSSASSIASHPSEPSEPMK